MQRFDTWPNIREDISYPVISYLNVIHFDAAVDIIDINAAELHNKTWSKTELEQKKFLKTPLKHW